MVWSEKRPTTKLLLKEDDCKFSSSRRRGFRSKKRDDGFCRLSACDAAVLPYAMKMSRKGWSPDRIAKTLVSSSGAPGATNEASAKTRSFSEVVNESSKRDSGACAWFVVVKDSKLVVVDQITSPPSTATST